MKKIVWILYICISVFAVKVVVDYFRNVVKVEEPVVRDVQETAVIEKEPAVEEVATDWDKFIEAVIWKESRGNASAIGDNGKAVGVLQIHPIMVKEANRILAMAKSTKEYALDDRYDREKSIEIFNIVQNFHNKSHDFDRALQIWNKNHPDSYKTQIINKYNELVSN